MYEYIKGTYAGMNKDYIVVENNGIGYKIHTSGSTLAQIPKIDEEIKLYLQQIVREDFIGLYGFLTTEELNMFKLLLTINGVGAKAALSLLSISNVNNLKYAILSSDEKTITRAPGIGKKMAQRIILELKDKIKPDELVAIGGEEILSEENTGNVLEALEALIALGYTEKEAQKVLDSVNKSDTLENIIKNSLRLLMN
ncbi:Holliday junction branch migration protein RuvA [Clostridium magnum]|uniref:Holliday junction branch migration complex subunit RuvA n=1 Tax=Clostridium magnum DSM 2767 TaxID=1121326 RepID=A0A162UCM4_9CLOT|nr:Holliday junction branch migration protein RuvA [Clostridium magnum]KZL93761.1 holliday junction ATP-dependent DNA helicase RuvA [Clostridium magnum DSM 2767]SHI09265.1 Holliday junction DNA helicase subunit RuvA [Clostridium magnum DSM 2767]